MQGGQVAFMRLKMFLQINNLISYYVIMETVLFGIRAPGQPGGAVTDEQVQKALSDTISAGKNNNASKAAMNLLTGAGIPVRTVSTYKILHDKVIVSDGRHTEVGSFNFSRTADRSNSENVFVVWDDLATAQKYLNHWTSRWAQGTDWKQTY